MHACMHACRQAGRQADRQAGRQAGEQAGSSYVDAPRYCCVRVYVCVCVRVRACAHMRVYVCLLVCACACLSAKNFSMAIVSRAERKRRIERRAERLKGTRTLVVILALHRSSCMHSTKSALCAVHV